MEEDFFTIKQVSEQLDIPVSRVRYYCNKGLIPYIKRGIRRQRIFTPQQRDQLFLFSQLCNAGFNVKELRHYRDLSISPTIEAINERKAMLTTLKNHLHQQIRELTKTIDFLEFQEECADSDMATLLKRD